MKDVVFYNYTEKEALEYTSKIVDFGVSLIVYAALNELRNAHYLIQRSKYYRQTIKKRANNALRLSNQKIVELKSIVMHSEFAETYWDSVIDASEKDVNNLKEEIKKVIEEAGIGDSELFSKVETARVLLEAAKVQFEVVIRDCTNKFRMKNYKEMKNLNLFDTFHEFYIDSIYREWNIVYDELYCKKYNDVELRTDNTLEAFNIIADKFAKGEYVKGCQEVACKEFPEFANAKVVVEE